MSAKDLLEMTSSVSSAVTDTQAIRDRIHEEFGASTSSEQRDALLAMLHATLNIAESWIEKHGDEKQLAEFRERRADEYTRLIVQSESCVDGIVSPEMLMAVTNREIAAGRMALDDPTRQIAVQAAASPHLSHAEMLDNAAKARKSDILIQSIVDELTSAKTFDIVDARAKVQRAFDGATTIEQRGRVLAMFKAVTDQADRHTAAYPDRAQVLADFRQAVAQDYKIFIVQESTVGLDTPVVGGDVSIEMLMAVTNREIAAGRMTEDHSLRKIAVEGAAAPHLSHAELVAKHARLKQEAAEKGSPPVSAVGSAPANGAEAVGTVLGRRFKSLFRKTAR
jgi:hypothetical protein